MAMSLQQTKTRIRSVASTKKITKAMELVATSKLKRAKDLNIKITPYKNEVFEIISYCVKNIQEKDYKYFNENKVEKKLYIIVTSSLGLCGGYNIAVEKFAMDLLENGDDIIVIGSKGINYFKDKGFKMICSYPELPDLSVRESISEDVARKVLAAFDSGNYKNINMIYTKFINSLTFDPQVVQLLPLSSIVEVNKIHKELLLEPTAEEVLNNLLPFYLTTSIKGLLFESMLSEQASRRTAMENATDNATELEDKLLLEFNKSRQASITQEITEISGAANAIK